MAHLLSNIELRNPADKASAAGNLIRNTYITHASFQRKMFFYGIHPSLKVFGGTRRGLSSNKLYSLEF